MSVAKKTRISRSKTLFKSLSEKAFHQQHDRDCAIVNFSRFIHDSKQHDQITKKLLKEYETILKESDNRREGGNKSLSEEERARAEAEAQRRAEQTARLKNKAEDAMSYEVIRAELLQRIENYKFDGEAKKELIERVQNKQKNKVNLQTQNYLTFNKAHASDYREFCEARHLEYLEKELKKRETAWTFHQVELEESRMQMQRVLDERLEESREEALRKKLMHDASFRRKHEKGEHMWLSLLAARRLLLTIKSCAENLEEFRAQEGRRIEAARRIQRAWSKYRWVSSLANCVGSAHEANKIERKQLDLKKWSARVIHSFLTDCGSHILWNRIRFHVFGHSMRGKVVKLQRWWRRKMLQRSQVMGKLMLQWKRIERQIIQDEAIAQAGKNSKFRSPKKDLLSPKGLKSPPSSQTPRKCASPAANRMRGAVPLLARLRSPSSSRRIPKEKREEVVMDIYRRRRKEFREQMRAHSKEMMQYRKRNEMNLQMNEMRKSLGLPPDPKFKMEIKPHPTFSWQLDNSEMKKIILDVRKEITMKKLRDIVEAAS